MMITQEDQGIQLENSRKQQLAAAVRSIQWTYAIFWSLSTVEQGVLEWGEGYYNGHIKTKKTVNSKNVNHNNQKISLERSVQLRKIYEALLEGESEQRINKLSIALSLEELSDLEWYYLVSMSFTFKIGQSLPGKALATGQHIWLCDAQSADSKVFSRSLLAKSASIQTVICFPHMEGVVELGVTKLVSEDMNLIHQIKTTLFQVTKPVFSPKVSSAPQKADSDKCQEVANVNENEGEQMKFDEDIENGLYQCVLEDFIGSPDGCSNDSCHHEEESVYGCTSSFMPWKKEFTVKNSNVQASQSVLKKVLSRVPLMDTYSSSSSSVKGDGTMDHLLRPQETEVHMLDFAQETIANIMFSELEEKRESQLYMVQESTIPSITETDEALFSTDTMECLARFDELQFGIDMEGTSATRTFYMLEQTSDKYNKSKTSEISNETDDPDLNKATQMDILPQLDIEIGVSIDKHEVHITIRCPWREYLLIDILRTLKNLNLDTDTVQSSTLGGTFSLFLKSEFQRAAFASEEVIKQALGTTIGMC